MELLVFGHTHHWVACYTHHGKSCTLVLIYCFGSPEIGYFSLMWKFQSLPGRFRPFCMKLSVHCSHIFYIVQDIIPPHDSSHLHIVHRMSLKAGLTKSTNIRPTLISFRADALFNCWNWRTTWTRSTLYSTIIVYSIEWHFCCVAVNVSTNRDPLYFWQCHHKHFTSNSSITNLKPPILMQLNFIRTAWLRNLKVKNVFKLTKSAYLVTHGEQCCWSSTHGCTVHGIEVVDSAVELDCKSDMGTVRSNEIVSKCTARNSPVYVIRRWAYILARTTRTTWRQSVVYLKKVSTKL